jgi:hypothetical protein
VPVQGCTLPYLLPYNVKEINHTSRGMYIFFFLRFSVPCIFYRLQNKSLQQMQPNIYIYCICYFSPYMFRALTGPSSGVKSNIYNKDIYLVASVGNFYFVIHYILFVVLSGSDRVGS